MYFVHWHTLHQVGRTLVVFVDLSGTLCSTVKTVERVFSVCADAIPISGCTPQTTSPFSDSAVVTEALQTASVAVRATPARSRLLKLDFHDADTDTDLARM